MNFLILVAQFWTAFAPIGYQDMSASELVKNWFELYLAFPIILVCFIGYKLWYRTRFVRINEIDITSGRRDAEDLADILAEERRRQGKWPWWKKAYRFMC